MYRETKRKKKNNSKKVKKLSKQRRRSVCMCVLVDRYQFGKAECIGVLRRWTSGCIHGQRFVQTFRIGGRCTHETCVIFAAPFIAQFCVACVARFVAGQRAKILIRCTQTAQASAFLQWNWKSIERLHEIVTSRSVTMEYIFTLLKYGHTASGACDVVVLIRRP